MLGNYINTESNKNKTLFPNIKGKTLTEAIKIAKEYNIKLNPRGKISGKIFSQSIKPGSLFKNGEICNVKLKDNEIK